MLKHLVLCRGMRTFFKNNLCSSFSGNANPLMMLEKKLMKTFWKFSSEVQCDRQCQLSQLTISTLSSSKLEPLALKEASSFIRHGNTVCLNEYTVTV